MTWNIYVVDAKIIVPTFARTSAGFYVEVEPVHVGLLNDIASSIEAIAVALETGNPPIPTPDREKHLAPVILRHGGVKSWPAFLRKAMVWNVENSNGLYKIVPLRKVTLDGRPALTKDRDRSLAFSDEGSARRAAHKILDTILIQSN